MNIVDLEVHSLGKFMVKKDGDIISDRSRGADKLWTLFQYLLSHPSDSVTPEKIIDDLDFSMDLVDAKNALENRIYRLRKLLTIGDKYQPGRYINYTRGGYQLNWENGGWFDIKEFYESCQKGEKLYMAGNKQEAADEFLRAFRVYEGDYLKTLYNQPWVINRRVQYRQMYLEAVINAAEILSEHKEYIEMEKILRRAAKIEPFEEEVQKLLIETYLKQNKTNKAKRYYSYLETLFAQIGVEPFPELNWNSYGKKEAVQKPDTSEFDLESLQEQLDRAENELDFIAPDIFQKLVLLEKKRTFRDKNISSFIVSINLENLDLDVKAEDDLVNMLKGKIKTTLRTSDIICQCQQDKFLLLFRDVKEEEVHCIFSRIEHSVTSEKLPETFQINYSYQAV